MANGPLNTSAFSSVHQRFSYTKFNTSYGNHFVESDQRSGWKFSLLDVKYWFRSLHNKMQYYWNKLRKVGWFKIVTTLLAFCLLFYAYKNGTTSLGKFR